MNIEFNALLLAILAALLAAGRSYWLKATDARLLLYGASNAVCFGIAVLLLPFIPVPSMASMAFLLSSSVIYTIYALFQLHVFHTMDISRLEPLQRSIRIGVLALCSPLLLGESVTIVQVIAIVLTIIGINMLIDLRYFRHKAGLESIGKCCFAGMLGGMLTLSDIMGIRISGAPLSYIVWNLFIGVPVVILALTYHYKALVTFLRTYKRNTVMMCSCDVLSYGLVLFILYGLQVGEALPLLNVSIIFSALFGMRYLDEAVSKQNWAAIVLITLSISAVQLA